MDPKEPKHNVVDKYREWANDLVRDDLKKCQHPFAALGMHVQGDFSLGTILRSANIFGAQEMFYHGGKRSWDRRSAVGSHHYSVMTHLPTMEDVLKLKEKYTFVAVDNIPGSKPIETFTYPGDKPYLFIFGEEGAGLQEDMTQHCEHILEISQYGSVRSLNVATAATVVFYDFVNKYKGKHVQERYLKISAGGRPI